MVKHNVTVTYGLITDLQNANFLSLRGEPGKRPIKILSSTKIVSGNL